MDNNMVNPDIQSNKNQKYKMILASGSPRRKDILAKNNIEFEVIKSDCLENSSASDVDQYVTEIAEAKGKWVANQLGKDFSGFILSADTVVALGNTILGKPHDEADAIRMISDLSGKCHSVFTGVSIIRRLEGNDVTISFAEETKVYVKEMCDEEIQEYVRCGECMDKAGAYAIQGRFGTYIDHFEGDYENVVGLPFFRVKTTLDELGFL